MRRAHNPRSFQRHHLRLFFWVFLLCLPTHPCTHYFPYPVETCTPPLAAATIA